MISDQLTKDLKQAMRERNDAELRTIRSLRSAIQQREIAARGSGAVDLPDEEIVSVLQKQARQRREAIEQYQAANRVDLVKREEEELSIITRYLPVQMTEREIESHVRSIIEDMGAGSPADIGKVMAVAMQRLKGKADGRTVQQAARTILSA